jgi:glycerol-3-phosphate acyltransferase PlsY
MLNAVLWTCIGLLAGSLPFSYWLGKLFIRKDIRKFGDGNPGAANAIKAGGWKVGVPAILLDGFKGLLPVLFARLWGDVSGWWLVPVALAPIVGHAFSPFLRFRGGKAVASTVGVWLGLAGFEAIIVFAIFTLATLLLQQDHALCVVVGMTGLMLYYFLARGSNPLATVAFGNLGLLIWKHRQELAQPVKFRDWARNFILRFHRSA